MKLRARHSQSVGWLERRPSVPDDFRKMIGALFRDRELQDFSEINSLSHKRFILSHQAVSYYRFVQKWESGRYRNLPTTVHRSLTDFTYWQFIRCRFIGIPPGSSIHEYCYQWFASLDPMSRMLLSEELFHDARS